MDEIQLKRSEQDYYISTDEEVAEEENNEKPPNISITGHKIENGSISFIIKPKNTISTKTISSDDIDSPNYRKVISKYIKDKAKKSFEKNKSKNQIKFIKNAMKIKKEIKYAVMFMDGHEEILSSFEMKQNYPQELLAFLEDEILNSD